MLDLRGGTKEKKCLELLYHLLPTYAKVWNNNRRIPGLLCSLQLYPFHFLPLNLSLPILVCAVFPLFQTNLTASGVLIWICHTTCRKYWAIVVSGKWHIHLAVNQTPRSFSGGLLSSILSPSICVSRIVLSQVQNLALAYLHFIWLVIAQFFSVLWWIRTFKSKISGFCTNISVLMQDRYCHSLLSWLCFAKVEFPFTCSCTHQLLSYIDSLQSFIPQSLAVSFGLFGFIQIKAMYVAWKYPSKLCLLISVRFHKEVQIQL